MFDAQLLRGKISHAEEIYNTLEPSHDLEEREFLLTLSNAFKYYLFNRGEKALEWLKRAILLAKKSGDKRFLYKGFHYGGWVYHLKGKNDVALDYAKKTINLSKELSHKVYAAHSYRITPYMHWVSGNLSEALENINKSMETDGISKQTMVHNFRYLGAIYREKGELDKALEYIEQGLQLAKDIGAGDIGVLLGVKGGIYWN